MDKNAVSQHNGIDTVKVV